MDANSFIITLKADGSESDVTDLHKFLVDLKKVLSTSPSQSRGQIALNVLSILCRNLDKVPSWCEKIDHNAFLTLCIECIRETRGMDKGGQVKTLACIQHIHKYIVAQKNAPPVYVLKLSYMPFECNKEKLLKEYYKTYWDILANRLNFLEKLKSDGVNLTKLLKKCTEDIQIVILLYDTEQFCKIILLYLIKKLYFLYSGNTKEFNVVCAKIFEFISKKDLQSFNRLSEKDSLVLYRVFNECIYVIVDNSTKMSFEESPLSSIIKNCISILVHNNFIVQCFETIYLNTLCVILSNKTNANTIESALTNLMKQLLIKKRVGHEKVFVATYPFVAQLLRLYMEFVTTNYDTIYKGAFVMQILDACLNLMLFLMDRSRKTELLTKCVGCTVKSGIHDGWRLSLSAKSLIDISLTKGFDLTNSLSLYYKFVKEQYSILDELYKLKCANFKKYFRKLQTDIHNIAIGLNKSEYYDYSLKLFDIYIKVDLQKSLDAVNISRAFFNKAICELDKKLYENALRDAYLSLVFSQPDGQITNKYMNLILDIKSRAVKDIDNDLDKDFQMITVLDSCKLALEQHVVPKGLVGTFKFSVLLKLEFSMYATLWPSMVPIAGVWRSLYDLASGIHDYWVSEDEGEQTLLWSLYEIILETPTIVRTVHNEIYKQIVTDLLERYEESMDEELKIVYCTLMFLKAEYDLADASQEYSWKVERNMFLEDHVTTRTVVQEQTAIQRAVRAVEILTDVIARINRVKNVKIIGLSLKTIQIFVMQLLHLSSVACALQLASVCCRLASLVGDEQTYVRNAGTILYHSSTYHHGRELLACGNSVKKLMQDKNTLQTALVFLCDAAIFYIRCGLRQEAANLVRLVQGKILSSEKRCDDVNLQIATGRLLEAQSLLCTDSGLSPMSSAMCVQRDYLSISGVGEIWCDRHLQSLMVKHHSVLSGQRAVRLWRGAGALRRARACAASSLPRANAAGTARLLAAVTDAASVQHAQPTIDNRLKYLLQLETDAQVTQITPQKKTAFTPKVDVFETALQCRRQREPASPTQSYLTIPAFRTPDCLARETCVCRACETPDCTLLTLQTLGLQASVHFRTNELQVANNHFEGVLEAFSSVDKKVLNILKKYKSSFDANILDIVKKAYESESKIIQLEILLEAAFLKLAQKSYEEAEGFMERIKSVSKECNLESYLRHEVTNLGVCLALLRRVRGRAKIPMDIADEFESLHIAPPKTPSQPQKTPENRVRPKTRARTNRL